MHSLHPGVLSLFLEENNLEFWNDYKLLFQSDNFVTKNQSLEVLHHILLKSEYEQFRIRFLSAGKNLAITMTLLADESKKIQNNAYNLFILFLLNPSMPPAVRKILAMNQEKLIRFVTSFQKEREGK